MPHGEGLPLRLTSRVLGAGRQAIRRSSPTGTRLTTNPKGTHGQAGTTADLFSFSMASTMARTPFSVDAMSGVFATSRHLRDDVAGVEHGHLDPRAMHVGAEPLGEVADRGLGGGVRRDVPRHPAQRGERRDHHQVTGALGAEDRGGRLGLGQRADEVCLGGLLVGIEAPGAERLALAEAGVDDDAVDAAELVPELVEHPEDGVVVGDVERLDGDATARVGSGDLGGELGEAVGTTRAEGEVVAQQAASWPARNGPRSPSPNGKTGDKLAHFADVTLALRTSSDLGVLLETVNVAARALLGARECRLFLIDERTGAVRPWDTDLNHPGDAFLPESGGALEWMLRHEEPLFVAAPRAGQPVLEKILWGRKTGAFLCLPLAGRGSLSGVWVASLAQARELQASDRLAAHVLGDALAVAIERSRSDRTLVERAEQAQRLESRAEEGEALLGQMLSVVAHEMRTPLTCIKAYAETLIDTPAGRVGEPRRRSSRSSTRSATAWAACSPMRSTSRASSPGQRSLHLTHARCPRTCSHDVLLTIGARSQAPRHRARVRPCPTTLARSRATSTC